LGAGAGGPPFYGAGAIGLMTCTQSILTTAGKAVVALGGAGSSPPMQPATANPEEVLWAAWG